MESWFIISFVYNSILCGLRLAADKQGFNKDNETYFSSVIINDLK